MENYLMVFFAVGYAVGRWLPRCLLEFTVLGVFTVAFLKSF
jgi:hypothetical protein